MLDETVGMVNVVISHDLKFVYLGIPRTANRATHWALMGLPVRFATVSYMRWVSPQNVGRILRFAAFEILINGSCHGTAGGPNPILGAVKPKTCRSINISRASKTANLVHQRCVDLPRIADLIMFTGLKIYHGR